MIAKPVADEPLEAAACGACGSAEPGEPAFTTEGFAIVRCPACRVLRVSPRLTVGALQAYYGPAYWKSADSVQRGYFDYAGDEANIRRTFRRRWRWLGRVLPAKGNLLDMGCASGFLLDTARTAGWKDVWGVEWSEHARQSAPPEVRGRIAARLEDLRLPPGSLDCVTAWDYLEHSLNPRAELEQWARLLNPGGWLSLIIPDAGSWLARFLGPAWEEFKKPREHLHYFTGRQLRRLLADLGLQVKAGRYEGKYASLQFAFSRFKPGDGVLYGASRLAAALARWLGQEASVVYVNPYDKLHLLARKERNA
ncbi:MAG: class I SAM-dependent methyltransferase [candidate division FCPU426 bacterium]